jgi:RNA polymerase sigma factor (TIGR02999 family)
MEPEGMGEAVPTLETFHEREPQSAEELLPLVYGELRRLATYKLANERPGQTLQPTALVHEVYLRLANAGPTPKRYDRAAFMGAAAESMRRIRVDSARRKRRLKHGGDLQRVDLEAVELLLSCPDDQVLALDEALERLSCINPRAATMVKLCYFVGLTQAQAAHELSVSVATAKRLWAFARAWLFRDIKDRRIERSR